MKFICLVIFISFSIIGFSQSSNNKIVGRVVYQFSHKRDTTNTNSIYKEDMVLQFSLNASEYRSYKLMQNDSINEARLEEYLKTGSGKNSYNSVKGTHEQIVNYFTSGEFLSINPWANDTLLISSKKTNINWKVEDSIKIIGGFNCKKAIGEFKGRIYEAWFCPEISIQSGPWKLYGLPGLILEAFDSKKDIRFSFSSFQNIVDNKVISISRTYKKTTNKEFEKMKEALLNDPSGYISTIISGQNNGSGTNSNSSIQLQGPGNRNRTIKKINNPLELVE